MFVEDCWAGDLFFRLMHCSVALHRALQGQSTFVDEGELFGLVAAGVHEELARRMSRCIPAAPSLRLKWVDSALRASTSRLGRAANGRHAVGESLALLSSMREGREQQHLSDMLRRADYKGSDVRLVSGELVDGCRQELPCPAGAWDWFTVQAYPWRQSQHINVLEFIAYITYIRSLAASTCCHGVRYFHIFDSRVVACVVAKGRSSARVLNRCCRRHLALSLATDTYVLTLWTISQWNFADAASRLHASDHG